MREAFKNFMVIFSLPIPGVPGGKSGTGKSTLLFYKEKSIHFPAVPGKKSKNGKSIICRMLLFLLKLNSLPDFPVFPMYYIHILGVVLRPTPHN
jgi:hypothetical protein